MREARENKEARKKGVEEKERGKGRGREREKEEERDTSVGTRASRANNWNVLNPSTSLVLF